ncbi:hypothetical protein [Actinomadura algeriensis]|uniref:DNA-directed RNA polymerase specialized sigma24 family protein n=1 Tax=Actinomadura algeriensis TaxID=1679523 RepID=A0ABR9JTR3_9ACTN|nr:hypothetical protein [Actinomadura algeriensis]MBE1533962.1 hypothetical protein [Actinomadura algeriensis]
MTYIHWLADPDRDVAFGAFNVLIVPALRRAAQTPLRNARHAGRPCPDGAWCADCEEILDDIARESFARLRDTFAGFPPRTRTGAVVHQMIELRDHITSEHAAHEEAAPIRTLLQRSATESEPHWLRAARSQLIRYPLHCLEERVRRDDAVRRGGAAHPERDLRTARWAAPFREDPVDAELLLIAISRTRRGCPDPFEVPAHISERLGLEPEEAAARMNGALRKLRTVRPDFYEGNLTRDEPSALPTDLPDPAPRPEGAPDRVHARAELERKARRRNVRLVIAEICNVAAGRKADPVRAARRFLLDTGTAENAVRNLATLVADAGLDWTDELTRTVQRGG